MWLLFSFKAQEKTFEKSSAQLSIMYVIIINSLLLVLLNVVIEAKTKHNIHLADAFIQSNLQSDLFIQSINIFFVSMYSLGIEPTTFALLTQCFNH